MVLPPDYEISENAKPWSGSLGDFDGELLKRQLVLKPRVHFPDVESAQASIEPYLRGWEAHEHLCRGLPIRFEFDSGQVRDRTVEGGVGHATTMHSTVYFKGSLSVAAPRYPEPPEPWFRETELVRRVRTRWRAVNEGREQLLPFAYLCLTELETEFGGRQNKRKRAGQVLHVDQGVLRKLGELTGLHDLERARKAGGTKRPLDSMEEVWIKAVVPHLLLRAVRAAAGVDVGPPITMADLPSL